MNHQQLINTIAKNIIYQEYLKVFNFNYYDSSIFGLVNP